MKNVSDSAGKILIHTASGVIVSGTTGGLGRLLDNVMRRHKIDKKQVIEYLMQCGASELIATLIWSELEEQGYIENNEFTPMCELGISLGEQSDEVVIYQSVVNDIYQLTKDIWRGVWESAAESAALGGMLTGVVSTTNIINH